MPRKIIPKRHPIDQSKLYKLQSRRRLAELLSLTRESLDAVLSMDRPYSRRQMEETRNGKVKQRTIQEPRGDLRPIHAYVSKILSRIEPPGFLFCPVKRRSYVSNAAQHINSKVVRTLDIKNYFPSTPRHRVFWFFSKVMLCSLDVSAVLAQLLTADAVLATGSTVSPILSFFAFYDMWLAIGKIAQGANCIITVYMDDVTLSGESVPNSLIWEIKKKIHSRGLRYHKERHYQGSFAEITGIVLRQGKMMVPNRQLKKAFDTRRSIDAALSEEEVAPLNSRLRGLIVQRRQVEAPI
jgi:uncharacterized membrane protein YccF (DUF307 family)